VNQNQTFRVCYLRVDSGILLVSCIHDNSYEVYTLVIFVDKDKDKDKEKDHCTFKLWAVVGQQLCEPNSEIRYV